MAAMLTAQLLAMQAVLLTVQMDLEDAESEVPEISIWPIRPIDEALQPVQVVLELVRTMLEDREHLVTKAWVFDEDLGTISPDIVVSTGTAHGWLNDLNKKPKSQYRMPQATDAQVVWQEWFQNMSGIEKGFPPSPPLMMISAVSGDIPQSDIRIAGWHAKVANLPPNEPPTFKVFLAHVRGQILATVTTKREAWTELQELTTAYKTHRDCPTLSNKLTQLLSQMYPGDEQDASEPEPVPKRTAILKVRNILDTMKQSRHQSTLIRSWKAEDSYRSTDLFNRYLDIKSHTADPKASEYLLEQYFVEVVKLLENAHNVYVQDPSESGITVLETHELGAETKAKPAKRKKAKTSVQAPPHPYDTQPEPSTVMVARKPPSAGIQKMPASMFESKPEDKEFADLGSYARAAFEIGKEFPNMAPGVIREKYTDLPLLDKHGIRHRMMAKGCCFICLESTHLTRRCELRTNSASPCKGLADELFRRWNSKVFPRGTREHIQY